MRSAAFHREKGYITHPMPTPINKNQNSDRAMYLSLSRGSRRLKNPRATETASANNTST